MNFTNIKYFLAIVEAGGISSASRNLYISQQALSEQLKKLEAELGIGLLCRNPFRLTDAGVCFYEGCKKLVGTYDDMMSEIESIVQTRQKKITIAVPTYCTHPCLLDFLGYFQRKYPEYEVTVIKRQHTDIAHNMNGVNLYLSYLPLSPDLENHILLDSDPYYVTFQRTLGKCRGAADSNSGAFRVKGNAVYSPARQIRADHAGSSGYFFGVPFQTHREL